MRRAAIAATALLALVLLYVTGKPPLLEPFAFGVAYVDRGGRLLRLALAEDERYRMFTRLGEVSPQLVEATLLYEDRWFRWHPGVNPVALAEAAVDTYVHERKRGGSTITMQLARLRFGIDSSRVLGKLEQMARALQLELYYSKNDLLEAYLNVAPYGGNIEGVGAASLVYFDRDVSRLSLGQALTLSVIPQKPSQRAPDREGREPQDLVTARKRLANAWVTAHPDDDATARISQPLQMRRRDAMPFDSPHFVTALRDAPGPRVRTTIDLHLQQLVERRARDFVERWRRRGISNVSVMLAGHRSLDVLASLGSVDFDDAAILGQVDGTSAPRSPGSALKPFIYALALDEGLIHPRSLLADAPKRFGAYNPENFDGQFTGPLTATEALVRSRNVPAVELQTRLRHPGLHALLARAQIERLQPAEHYGLAIVLGGIEVTMSELVELYAMLARGGKHGRLRRRLDKPLPQGPTLLTPQAAHLILEMLRENPRPGQTFRDAWVRDPMAAAWKTGTSYGYRDAWAVGVLGPWVLAVWVGNFDGRGNPAFVGRRSAGPLFFEIADALRPRLPDESIVVPPGVVEVDVCAVSGELPTLYCPRTRKTGFVPGVSPIHSCSIHREVLVNAATGLRSCDGSGEPEVYEFWPSELLRLFEAAGLPRRAPPPYHPDCDSDDRNPGGTPPRITSPVTDVVYSVRLEKLGRQAIPLRANVDAGATQLYWFVGSKYLGKSSPAANFEWRAEPGDHVVRVVDDAGRSDAVPIAVALVE